MDIPEDLRYTGDHEWVRLDGDQARVGITDYAQDALNDVVYVDLPELDREVAEGDVIAEIESSKSVSEIYAPIAGTITAVNTDLEGNETLVNSDPYGEGWLFAIAPADPSAIDALLDADGYRTLTES